MVKTAANPGGLAIDVFDGLRAAQRADRAQFYLGLPTGPFYGFNSRRITTSSIPNCSRSSMSEPVGRNATRLCSRTTACATLLRSRTSWAR